MNSQVRLLSGYVANIVEVAIAMVWMTILFAGYLIFGFVVLLPFKLIEHFASISISMFGPRFAALVWLFAMTAFFGILQ